MATTLLGTPVSRVDGRKKVTGSAQYAAEVILGEMSYAVIVGSSRAGGTIRHCNADAARRVPGVLLVLTPEDGVRFGKLPSDMMAGGVTAESRPPLADNRVLHNGMAVAIVVAEQLEQAHYAASLLEFDYEDGPFAVDVDDAKNTLYHPEAFMHEPLTFERGDVKKGLAEADLTIDQTYATAIEHPCALEPHATIASWSGDMLTVYNSTQWVMGDRTVLAAAFGIPPEKVRVQCPFTGGMFGSKGATPAHTLLVAYAARELGRPVKVVLSFPQVLTNIGHRSQTVQRFQIGAKRNGTLTAISHHVTSHTSLEDEFPEPASLPSRMLYKVDNYRTEHEMTRLNVMKPSWMRAPGEAPGTYALECAMDELAVKLNLDPVDLRRINHASEHAAYKKPFSSKHLLECYSRGAERFGWSARNPQPGSLRYGSTLIGWGMATAAFPGYLMGATVNVRLEGDATGARAIVSTAGSDVGTGMYTMLTMTVAEALGLPLDRVNVELGSTDYVNCAVAGGSNLTASTAPAATDACTEIKRELLKIAGRTADGFTGAQALETEFIFSNGRLAHRSHPGQSIAYSDLLALDGRTSLEAQGQTTPIFGQNEQYAFESFGAHFVEVRVLPSIGRVRVSRVVSVFDCGRILSPKTARSQFQGAIIFGIGSALFEELIYDRVHGHPVNADLAGYLLPVHADIPEIDVSWIDEPDYKFNSMGCRGVGEIGVTGVSAAIANAVYHATGKRVRDLPITPDKLL